MRIGLVGAPSSGKSSLAAMLYAELLIAGVEGAYLIQEYAKEWLASGNKFESVLDQMIVSNRQIHREDQISKTSFTHLVCDSCIWLGGIYANMGSPEQTPAVKEYLNTVNSFNYDVTIFVPMPDTNDHVSEFRVHNGQQSLHVQNLILEELKSKKGVIDAPKNFKDRAQFIKELRSKTLSCE